MKIENIKVKSVGNDLFVIVGGVRIARRGYPDTPQEGTWVSIEPGWEVLDTDGGIAIRHNGVSVH
jgi:hypothetical protein